MDLRQAANRRQVVHVMTIYYSKFKSRKINSEATLKFIWKKCNQFNYKLKLGNDSMVYLVTTAHDTRRSNTVKCNTKTEKIIFLMVPKQ